MVGTAMGLASRGAIPFPSTFACFLERASDFIRLAGISNSNVKLAGSHAGVSIGEDGPSQMALEDLAMMRGVPNCTVLYPCDGMSAERLVAVAATPRRSRLPAHDASEDDQYLQGRPRRSSSAARSHAARERRTTSRLSSRRVSPSSRRSKAHEMLQSEGIAIRVIDAYSIQPIDRGALVAAGRATNGRIVTVEDHYAHGGLGDAVSEAVWDQGFRVRRLAVREIPRSGPPEELLDRYGISARAIVDAVKGLVKL